jgi:hypothetical protein
MNESANPDATPNPLLDGGARWDEWIDAVGPAAMLVRIEHRMGEVLERSSTPEDIWQETLLHAWRDRERCECPGFGIDRKWFLQIRCTIHVGTSRRRPGRVPRSAGAKHEQTLRRARFLG